MQNEVYKIGGKWMEECGIIFEYVGECGGKNQMSTNVILLEGIRNVYYFSFQIFEWSKSISNP